MVLGCSGLELSITAGFKTSSLSLKSTPLEMAPMGGIRTSLTSELTTPLNAAPMMTPTARSTTLPRSANSLNSLIRPIDPPSAENRRAQASGPWGRTQLGGCFGGGGAAGYDRAA